MRNSRARFRYSIEIDERSDGQIRCDGATRDPLRRDASASGCTRAGE